MAKQIDIEAMGLPHKNSGVLYPLRELAHALLSLVAPIVGFSLAALGVLGLLDCFLHYLTGPPKSHFPMGLMLGLSLGSFFLSVLTSELLHALDPNKDS